MAAEEIKNALREAVRAQTGIVIETPDYVYALWEVTKGVWKQAWYSFVDREGEVNTIDERKALLLLIEEVSKSLVRFAKGGFRTIISEQELESTLEKIG